MSGNLITLAIDASTYTGTVAVLRGDLVVAEGEAVMRGEDEERLMPAVLAALKVAGCGAKDVQRVICGAGPGSFTSLRIAGAIAKGIAFGNDIPLYAVSSLALIIAGHRPALEPGKYLALLDAMRAERYASLFDVSASGAIRERKPLGRIAEGDVAPTSSVHGARSAGPLEVIGAAPHARGVGQLMDSILAAGPVSLDRWEPDYGRQAEAQVKWEAAHGRALSADVP